MFGTMDNVSVPLPDSQGVTIFKIVMLGTVDMLISVALSMKERNKGM